VNGVHVFEIVGETNVCVIALSERRGIAVCTVASYSGLPGPELSPATGHAEYFPGFSQSF
jgi:hypothetical protein